MKSKLSQIWVETAIYTLIGLSIIAILLAIVNPQIEKMKDNGIILQTIDVMNSIDQKVIWAEESPGRIGIVSVKISKGKMFINTSNDSISYILEDSSKEFSQENQTIKQGNLMVRTIKHGNRFNIYLNKYYNNLNITYKGENKDGYIQQGASAYNLRIENKGKIDITSKTNIDFSLVNP